MSALSWFDWRLAVALFGIIGAAFVLIAWQRRQSPALASEWLGYAALSLELLGLALSVFWAVHAQNGSVMPIIFVGGWIGMLVGRAILIPRAISPRTGFTHDLAVFGGLALAYLALYGSGLFHALNDSSDAADRRLESSLPAQALDAEIAATRSRLSNLAAFADASKAQADEQAQQASQQANSAALSRLRSQLAAKQAELSACPRNHITKCITPAKAAIASLEAQLGGIGGGAAGNGYASRHSEYNGLQAHLVELQKQRAALAGDGAGIAQAWTADDRFIAWVFGIEFEQANRIKWLIFTAIFDVLSLAFRIVSALITEGAGTSAIKRRLCALIDAGLSPQQAIASLDGSTVPAMQPAGVSYPHLDTGGRIETDGVAVMHAGEIVLNAKATAALDKLHPGLADSLNAGTNTPAPTPAPAPAPVPAPVTRNVPRTSHDVTRTSHDVPRTSHDVTREHVPMQLSGMAAKGRKGLIDTCPTCRTEFLVTAWNKVFCCEDCAAQANGYADSGSRRTAWANGRK